MYSQRSRPVGLILAAIALSLLTLYGFLNVIVFTLSAVVMFLQHAPAPTPGLPASYLAGVQIVMALIALAISTYGACTVVGLFRFKQWARISILIFGGLLAFFSTTTCGMFLLFALKPSLLPQPPETADAATVQPDMRIVFFVLAGFACLGALAGIWWLIYFNLRATRELFSGTLMPPPPPALGAPFSIPTVPTRQRGVVEILVMCLAGLYLFGAVSVLVIALARIPLFFGGFIVRGTPGLVAAVGICIAQISVAIGLFRRMRPAWFGAFAFNALGVLSILLLLIPANQAAFSNYQQEIFQHVSLFPATPGMPSPQSLFGPGYVIFLSISSCVTGAAITWLLIRARPFFQRPALSV